MAGGKAKCPGIPPGRSPAPRPEHDLNTSFPPRLVTAFSLLALVGCGPEPSRARPDGGPAGTERVAPEAQAPAPERLAAAETALLAGEFERADELLAEFVSMELPSGRAEFLFGLALHKRKRYPAAEPWFEAALRAPASFSGAASVHYFLGWCRYYLGDLEAARESFTEHRGLVPEEGDTVFGLGVVALDLGESERAAELFTEAIELHQRAMAEGATNLVPDLAKSFARLGDARAGLGDLTGARDALIRCVETYPPFHVAWFRLGSVLTELGDEAGAAAAFEQEARWKAAAAER